MTHKLLVARFTNAIILSGLSAWLALSYGSAAWANVVWFQSVLVFLPLITLGYNEGFGLELARCQALKIEAPKIFKRNLFLCSCLLLFLALAYQVIKFPFFLLLLPFALAGLLNFSLLRMYFRSVGDIDGLINFYFLNSALLVGSGLLTQGLSDPMWFVVFVFASQMISSSVALWRATAGATSGSPILVSSKSSFGNLIQVGVSLMLSGLLIEGIFHVDRLVLLNDQTQTIALLGVATLASKGGFMVLSVINVINYKSIANLISLKNKNDVTRILKRQTSTGVLLTAGLISAGVLATGSEWFGATFPSYQNLNFFIFWQGLFLLSFSVMVPLTTFLNLLRGGKFHLLVMAALCLMSSLIAITFAHQQLPISIFYIILNTLLFTSTLTMLVKVYWELSRWP